MSGSFQSRKQKDDDEILRKKVYSLQPYLMLIILGGVVFSLTFFLVFIHGVSGVTLNSLYTILGVFFGVSLFAGYMRFMFFIYWVFSSKKYSGVFYSKYWNSFKVTILKIEWVTYNIFCLTSFGAYLYLVHFPNLVLEKLFVTLGIILVPFVILIFVCLNNFLEELVLDTKIYVDSRN